MDTNAVCWVCSAGFEPGERVTRVPSLGIDVHSRCAQSILHDDVSAQLRDERAEDADDEDTAAA